MPNRSVLGLYLFSLFLGLPLIAESWLDEVALLIGNGERVCGAGQVLGRWLDGAE